MTRDEKYAATKKRNVQKATRRALRLIRKHHPATLLETSQLCLRLVYHGEGAFRKAYRIAGTKLLIKFPQTADRKTTSYGYTTDRCHTRSEVRKIKKLREFKSLRTHVPPVYYFNSRHGVMVTEFYPSTAGWRIENEMRVVFSHVIKELTGVVLEDLGDDNFKLNRRGELVFADLGY